MQSNCLSCQVEFEITDSDLTFLDSVSPLAEGRPLTIPPPKHCPECRQLRRLTFSNEMQLYHRRCDQSGSAIISIHSPDKPYPVYRSDIWWGNSWDSLSFGREYDFTQSFFEQFHALSLAVPRPAVQTNYVLDENSEYTNYAGSNKNCYLIFHADLNRDCMYGYGVKNCESCLDVYNVFSSELVYESIDCSGCYNLAFSLRCLHCSDSRFLEDCISCSHCFGCKNLHQKKYCIFNRQVTRAEYEQFIAENPLDTRQQIEKVREQTEALFKQLPNRFLRMQNSEDSIGDNLQNCKDVTDSFDVQDMRSGKYCFQIYNGARDCMDVYQFGLNAELVYDSSIVGINAYNIRFSHYCSEQVEDLSYCLHCSKSKHLFGCVGVRRKEYCILNKQYSRDDYETLLTKIVAQMQTNGEWGENLPSWCSAFGYNETTAQDYYPLTEQQANQAGFNWRQQEVTGAHFGAETKVPASLAATDDAICNSIVSCEVSGKSYKFVPLELKLHRQIGLPLPRRAPDQRHRDRMARRNPRMLFTRHCAECEQSITTNFPPTGNQQVLCEGCYQRAIE